MFGNTFSHHPASNMSMRELLRTNGQREPPCTPSNLWGYNQSNLGEGCESTYSQHYLEPYSYQEPFDYYHASPPLYQTPPCEYPKVQFLPYDEITQEDTIEDTLEDTLQQAIKFQGEVNSRVDESLNEIKSQLTLLIQTLVVREEDKSLVLPPIIPTNQECPSALTHPITHHRNEEILDQTILPQDLESKEDIPKESEAIIENVYRDEEFEREESEIEDSNQEEEGSTEATFNDDVGLLDVGNVQVNEDVDGLEVIPTASRDHEIPTFEPLTPSPSLPEPLELHVPTFEPTIIPMADQSKEGEGQALHGTSFIGPFGHYLFSTYHDPYYPYVLHGYIIEFIKVVAIVHSHIWMQFLKLYNLRMGDDGKFPLRGIG